MSKLQESQRNLKTCRRAQEKSERPGESSLFSGGRETYFSLDRSSRFALFADCSGDHAFDV